jgi:hypothetical protein
VVDLRDMFFIRQGAAASSAAPPDPAGLPVGADPVGRGCSGVAHQALAGQRRPRRTGYIVRTA